MNIMIMAVLFTGHIRIRRGVILMAGLNAAKSILNRDV